MQWVIFSLKPPQLYVLIIVKLLAKAYPIITQTNHPPTLPLPTHNFFLVSNERYGKNKTILLQYYDIDFAPIKRYRQFCSQAYMFYWTLFVISVCLSTIVIWFWSL